MEPAKELCRFAKDFAETRKKEINYFCRQLLSKTTVDERVKVIEHALYSIETYGGLLFSQEGMCGRAIQAANERKTLDCESCKIKEEYFQLTEKYRAALEQLTKSISEGS